MDVKLFYCVNCPAPGLTNFSSDTKDVESPGMNIFRHVGVLPFLSLLIPAHHYQESREGEGKSEDGNFHLSFIRNKSPGNSPSGLEIPY